MQTSKKLTAAVAALVGLGAMAFSAATALPVSAQTPPFARPHAGDRDDRHGERHPEIRLALRNLRQAQGNLQRAAHDFGGHREQALDLVQRAIDQCQQALRDDKH